MREIVPTITMTFFFLFVSFIRSWWRFALEEVKPWKQSKAYYVTINLKQAISLQTLFLVQFLTLCSQLQGGANLAAANLAAKREKKLI